MFDNLGHLQSKIDLIWSLIFLHGVVHGLQSKIKMLFSYLIIRMLLVGIKFNDTVLVFNNQ